MKKKNVAISIIAVLMLVAISYATALNTTDLEKKESPLYGIRTNSAIGVKISDILKNIKTKFLGERMFFLQFDKFSCETPPTPQGLLSMFKYTCYCRTEDYDCTIYWSSCDDMCPSPR